MVPSVTVFPSVIKVKKSQLRHYLCRKLYTPPSLQPSPQPTPATLSVRHRSVRSLSGVPEVAHCGILQDSWGALRRASRWAMVCSSRTVGFRRTKKCKDVQKSRGKVITTINASLSATRCARSLSGTDIWQQLIQLEELLGSTNLTWPVPLNWFSCKELPLVLSGF